MVGVCGTDGQATQTTPWRARASQSSTPAEHTGRGGENVAFPGPAEPRSAACSPATASPRASQWRRDMPPSAALHRNQSDDAQSPQDLQQLAALTGLCQLPWFRCSHCQHRRKLSRAPCVCVCVCVCVLWPQRRRGPAFRRELTQSLASQCPHEDRFTTSPPLCTRSRLLRIQPLCLLCSLWTPLAACLPTHVL